MLLVGDTANRLHVATDTGCGAVARIVRFVAVDLVQHGIVRIAAERFFHGLEVWLVRVRGDLRLAYDAAGAIEHEVCCPTRCATAYEVGDAELGIRVDGRPRPRIAPALLFLL